jgi:putative hydrolase of the HAD superfamily
MTKGYIFDYGGTLDTGGNHWGKVIWHAYERCRVPVTEQQFREAYVYAERTLGRNPIIQPDFTFRQTLEEKLRLQLEFLNDELNEELRMKNEEFATAPPTSAAANSSFFILHSSLLSDLYAHTQAETARSREVLLRLKARYPMVLVSNFYGNVGVVLREFGLDGIFQSIVESAVVGVRKPDPRIFTLGVEALGLKPEEVTVVGDSIDKDIIPAKKAGCQTVWFKGEGWTDEPVDESQADKVITRLDEVV